MEQITEFHQITLDEYMNIKEDLKKRLGYVSEMFVAIGYRLKQVKESEAYRQDGYETIFEFAQKECGLSKSVASRFMAINDKYSVGGNSLELREEFVGLGSSRLSEMLTMDPEDYVLVTNQTSVKEIRELKHMEKNPEEKLTKLQEVLLEEYKNQDKREELLDIVKATSMTDVKEAIIPEGYRLMKKGILAVKFDEERITIRTMGVTGVQYLTWEEMLQEYAKTFDFHAEDPWVDTYGPIKEIKSEKQKQEEKKKQEVKKTEKAALMRVATSQQEEQLPGQTSIEKDFPEYLPKDKKVEIPQTKKVEVEQIEQDGRRHKLKLAAMFFDDVLTGKKSFELRKNDRNYQIGDILELREMKDGEPTGREQEKEVIYILEGFAGLKDDYCILGIK